MAKTGLPAGIWEYRLIFFRESELVRAMGAFARPCLRSSTSERIDAGPSWSSSRNSSNSVCPVSKMS